MIKIVLIIIMTVIIKYYVNGEIIYKIFYSIVGVHHWTIGEGKRCGQSSAGGRDFFSSNIRKHLQYKMSSETCHIIHMSLMLP